MTITTLIQKGQKHEGRMLEREKESGKAKAREKKKQGIARAKKLQKENERRS